MALDWGRLSETGLTGDGPILDGLRRLGYDADGPIDRANSSHPQLVAETVRAYADAGAGLICTNTLGANRLALRPYGLAGQTEDLNRVGAAISRGAADAAARPVAVAGQMGPSGLFLRLGETNEAELHETFAEQAGWLERGGAEVLLLTRFLDLEELLIALVGARQATKLPVIAAMIFDSGADRTDTPSGQSPGHAADALAAAGADAVGCDGAAPETALSLTGLMIEHAKLPVFVRTTAGSPELEGGRVGYPETPDAFAARAVELRRRGAAIVAGCAGATPEHIRALSAVWPGAVARRARR